MTPTAQMCRKCKPSYQRTDEHRRKLSEALRGKPKPWLRGRKRPEHSETMKEWWTTERRDAKRAEMLKRSPLARYHGLSADGARAIRDAAGRCESCDGDGSESRLDVHHRNGDKRDQRLANLAVLCHRCHMRLHSEQGDLRRN
jgi:hypothetical protein